MDATIGNSTGGPQALPQASAAPQASSRTTRRSIRSLQLNEGVEMVPMTEDPKSKYKRKKRKAAQKPQDASPRTLEKDKVPQKPRKKCRQLADLPGMPFDILFEIFSHLMPYDILKLARTTKDFRALLLSKSSISLWKDTLRNVPSLPECPLEMSLPAWVNLVYSPHCQFCLAYTRSVEWRFRIRICTRCSKEHLRDLEREMYEIFPTGDGFYLYRKMIPSRREKRFLLFLMSDFDAVRFEYDALPEDERRAYVTAKENKIRELYKHAEKCEGWAKTQTQDRDIELRQLREERRAAIIRKLEELGWDKDIRSIRDPDSLAAHKLVDRPQRLTERIWINIKDGILEFMNQMREKRLERERLQLISQRKAIVIEILRAFKNPRISENQLMPEAPDCCAFGSIHELLNASSDAEISIDNFNDIVPLLPDLVAAWREEIHKKFIKSISQEPVMPDSDERRIFGRTIPILPAPTKPLPEDEVAQKITLAATVFSCLTCGYEGPSFFLDGQEDWSIAEQFTPIFYPQVLGHACFTRTTNKTFTLMRHIPPDPSVSLGSFAMFQRKQWSSDGIVINYQASELAEHIVKMAGLDAGTTTSNQMDSLPIRFACTSCAVDVAGDKLCHDKPRNPDATFLDKMPLFDWRGAVGHQSKKHCKSKTQNLIIVPEESLDESIKEAEMMLRIRSKHEWGCVHCLDTPKERDLAKLASVKKHLFANHDIASPVLNLDYFKPFAKLADTRLPILVDKSEEGHYSLSENNEMDASSS